MFARRRILTPTVIALGAVSLLTDLSSDMIYPLLPAFLVGVLGASATGLGVIEGIAEGTAAFLKLGSGMMADRLRRRKGLVVLGYGLSGLAKPLMALATAPWHVLGVRFADRVGKGVRSAPRDALLAAESDPERRGRVFGFHRAMDTLGAILGPLAALAILALAPERYRLLFGLAAVPAVLSVVILVVFVRDRGRTEAPAVSTVGNRTVRGVRGLGKPFWRLLAVVAVFTLGNSSDAFLLLRAEDVGIVAARLPLVWLFFNGVYALFAWLAGSWSDRIGRRTVVASGFAVYAAAYLGLALATEVWHLWGLFGLYGLYYGLTDGILRAGVADVAPVHARGTAYGVYYALTGVGLLVASIGAGALWDAFGPSVPFGVGAGLALVAALLAVVWVPGGKVKGLEV